MGRETNKQRREQQALSAREKAAASRAVAAREAQRRKALVILSSVVAVVVVAVAIGAYVLTRPAKTTPGSDGVPTTASIAHSVTNVSDTTLDTVGKGNATTSPTAVKGEPPLTSGGKPDLLYIGAEFCPFCAIERWSLAIALSKFGTLTKLSQVNSAEDDGNYASLDFVNPKYRADYNSKYLTFSSVENENRSSQPLEQPTAAQKALWVKLTNNSPGFPFLDFGNKLTYGAQAPLDPSALGTLTQAQVAQQINDPTSKVAKTVNGGANMNIAAICTMTNNQPSNVCSRPIIKTLQSSFGG